MIDLQSGEKLKLLKEIAKSEDGILIEYLEQCRDELDTNKIDVKKVKDLKLEYLSIRKARDKIDIIINILNASMD